VTALAEEKHGSCENSTREVAELHSPEPRLRVVLIDDHELVRAALRTVLEDAGIEILAEAGGGEEGIRLSGERRPDVVLLDLSMPDLSGIEVTRRLASEAPGSRVLVFTGSAEDHDVRDAIDAGASGYLLKDADPEEIVAAVRAAAAGESRISPRTVRP
jgi:DNA-binding NarL/FixJ family response regulator